jgi:hypothetical protein
MEEQLPHERDLRNTGFQLKNHILIRHILDMGILTSTEKLVAIAILTHRNPCNANCFPNKKTIARKCSNKERAVGYAIKGLKKKGVLYVISGRRGVSNRYIFYYDLGDITGRDINSILFEQMDPIIRNAFEDLRLQYMHPGSTKTYEAGA